MNKPPLSVLRLYFPRSVRPQAVGFWNRLMSLRLDRFLVASARHAGIQQVVLYPVLAGYLTGLLPQEDLFETTPWTFPVPGAGGYTGKAGALPGHPRERFG